MTGASERLHASCVCVNDKALLLVGASGSGKSATALAMIAHGATLIADDQVDVVRRGDAIFASCPDGYSGMIEARGIGILTCDAVADVQVTHIVDLDQTELQRLPRSHKGEILGVEIDLICGRDNWLLVPGLMALMRGGRSTD